MRSAYLAHASVKRFEDGASKLFGRFGALLGALALASAVTVNAEASERTLNCALGLTLEDGSNVSLGSVTNQRFTADQRIMVSFPRDPENKLDVVVMIRNERVTATYVVDGETKAQISGNWISGSGRLWQIIDLNLEHQGQAAADLQLSCAEGYVSQ